MFDTEASLVYTRVCDEDEDEDMDEDKDEDEDKDRHQCWTERHGWSAQGVVARTRTWTRTWTRTRTRMRTRTGINVHHRGMADLHKGGPELTTLFTG